MDINITNVEAELCKRSLAYFVKEFWSAIVPDKLVWGMHMEVLCNEVQAVYERVFLRLPKEYDLIINIPPGTSKSTIVTIMAPVWSWTRDPGLRHITISYSGPLSTEHAVKSRDVLLCEKFVRYFPDVELKKGEVGKTNYKTTKGGQRYATSITATITGKHAHIITVDDPMNTKQSTSIASTLEASQFFDKTIPTRKVDKEITPTILVMQRLSVSDPTGHLLNKKKDKIRHVCLPAELSKNVNPVQYKDIYINGLLDPKRMSHEILADMKIDLGSYNYAGQFMQTPAPEGGEIWQKWFIPIPDELCPGPDLMENYGTDWDLAYTDDQNNSANAYVTGGRFKGKPHIDDLGWKWCEFPELIRFMKTKPSPHYIEAKASGKSAKQVLVSNHIPAIEVKMQGGDKVARARSVTPYAEAGMITIRQSLINKLYNDEKQGILLFPKSEWTDLADALAQSITRLKIKPGMVSSSGYTERTGGNSRDEDKNMVDDL